MTIWMKMSQDARLLRLGMNVWPPFAGAGIVVEELATDYTYVRVALKPTVFNRNYVGTHFGGSLFAMTDPFFMLMLMRNLGHRYYVWDRSAHIDFVAPGKGRVVAEMHITPDDLQEMRDGTAAGGKFERDFQTEVVDESGATVARITKRIYARLKPEHRPAGEKTES
jgi:acyl-coenzyme A thioesterase PaaI-like protein